MATTCAPVSLTHAIPVFFCFASRRRGRNIYERRTNRGLVATSLLPPPFHRLSSQLLDPPLIFQRSQQASINREIFVTSCQRRKKDFITRNTPHISFFFPNESRLSTWHIRIHRIARWVILFFHTSVASRTSSSSQLHSKPSCYTYREWRSVVLFARKIRLIPCLLCFSCFLCFFITEKVRIPFK